MAAINVGYCRVSTNDQNNEKFEAAILKFCNEKNFGTVSFVAETVSGKKSWHDREIGDVIRQLGEGDRIITPELSRLGRSTLQVLEILSEARNRGIAIYSVKENLQLNNNDIQSKVMATLLSLFAELESTFISQRTKEGLANAKRNGKKLGRPSGRGRSKLDPFETTVKEMLTAGISKRRVLESLPVKISYQQFLKWLVRCQLHNVKPDYGKWTKEA